MPHGAHAKTKLKAKDYKKPGWSTKKKGKKKTKKRKNY